MSKLTGSLEDYLEAIYMLRRQQGEARITDLAGRLGLSKPSANRAVATLCEEGLAAHERYGSVELTDEGERIARDVCFRHEALLRFLMYNLGVDSAQAEEDACRMEHVISEETLLKLIAYSEKHAPLPRD